MKGQANEHELHPGLPKKNCSQKINRDHIFRVQHMKPDATAVRMENRAGQQMIQVNQHGRQEEEPISFPVLFVVPVGDRSYKDEMQEVMDEGLEHFLRLGVVSLQFSLLGPKIRIKKGTKKLKPFLALRHGGGGDSESGFIFASGSFIFLEEFNIILNLQHHHFFFPIKSRFNCFKTHFLQGHLPRHLYVF